MYRPLIPLFLLACATEPEPQGEDPPAPPPGAEPQTPSAPPADVVEEASPETQLTPGQLRNIEEGRAKALADLGKGTVQILDFGELASEGHVDPKTGLPMGRMGEDQAPDTEVWRDSYNDTVLTYVKEHPPFPPGMEIVYTVGSSPDGVQHLQLRITPESIERKIQGLDAPASIHHAERLRLGILAQTNPRALAIDGEKPPGIYYDIQVKGGARDWNIHMTEGDIAHLGGDLHSLLDEIGAR